MRRIVQAEIARRKARKQRIPRGTLQPPVNRIEKAFARTLSKQIASDLDAVIAVITERYPALAAGSQTAQVERAATVDSAEGLIRGMFHYVRLMIQGSDGKLRDAVLANAATINRRNRGWVQKQVETLIGINPMQSEPWLQEQLGLSVGESMTLIKSARGKAVDDIEALVMRSVTAGESTANLAKQMERIKGVTASRAKLIARDQTGKLLGNLTRMRMQELGITRYEWSTSGDERVRPMHKALNGEVFSWDDPPVTNEKGEHNNPGQDINCRCTALFVF